MPIRIQLFLKTLFSFLLIASAQAQVTFVVENLPANTPAGDNLYIAGNFTGWNPGAPAYLMHKNEQQQWTITLSQQAAGTVIQYKFTRGSWKKKKKGVAGEEIPDRVFRNNWILIGIKFRVLGDAILGKICGKKKPPPGHPQLAACARLTF